MIVREVRNKVWKIGAVCDERWKCDFLVWMKGLNEKEQTKINALLDRVAESGSPKNTEISHSISEDIWQWSAMHSYRIAWFYDEGMIIVISHVYKKTGQKTKRYDIEHASKVRERYFMMKHSGRISWRRNEPTH